MIKTAITGNIASGKSQVEKILVSLGFKVIDSDLINNRLIQRKDIIDEIASIFGTDIIDSFGHIIKQKLGEIVFNDFLKKQKLENILHKKIMDEIDKFFEKNNNENIVFASVPLLFEAKWESYFDKIIFVSAPEQIRIKRLILRNNYTEEYAKKRVNAQLDEKEKIKKSDFVIYNNSDIKSLEKSVIKIVNNLLNCFTG